MEIIQGMLWTKEYLDSIAPRTKTKKEINQENKEMLERKLLERYVLSNEEKEISRFPLLKEELINTMNYYNQLCETNFLNSKQGMADKIIYHASIFNLGIPQMLLTSLSQYSDKKQKDLMLSDLVIMYKSLLNILKNEEIKGDNFSKFRKKNGLTFFGHKQYLLMKKYAQSLKIN